MQVILLERIQKLGNLGETVKVAPGYARNFLIPQNKAVVANKNNIALFEERKAELETREQARLAALAERAKKIDGLELKIAVRASEEGKLFGSVSSMEIVNAAKMAGIEILTQEVVLQDGPIRALGEFEVEIQMHHSDIKAKIKLNIVAEE